MLVVGDEWRGVGGGKPRWGERGGAKEGRSGGWGTVESYIYILLANFFQRFIC